MNTSLGSKGDNNRAGAVLGGVGLNNLNLFGGPVTVLALAHIGPEIPYGTFNLQPNTLVREYYDAVLTWKATDALTATTELNWLHDDAIHFSGGGAAQYLAYQWNDQWTFGARAEIWRDEQGYWVAAYPGTWGFVDFEKNRPQGNSCFLTSCSYTGGIATYSELTIGATYHQPLPGGFALAIRPELRADKALSWKPSNGFSYGQLFGTGGNKPFGNNHNADSQFTAAVDAILSF